MLRALKDILWCGDSSVQTSLAHLKKPPNAPCSPQGAQGLLNVPQIIALVFHYLLGTLHGCCMLSLSSKQCSESSGCVCYRAALVLHAV